MTAGFNSTITPLWILRKIYSSCCLSVVLTEITKPLHPATHMYGECVQMPWGSFSGLTLPMLYKDKVQLREWAREAERKWETEREKSSVRWPHSDNKPGKSLSLEPFRNTTVVYTGGGWVEQDMQRACILQHLIMNTKHIQHVRSHRHIHTQALYPWSKEWLEFHFSCDN